MIRSFLVCYDICNPKRLRKVYSVMRSYGEYVQYSVSLCELTQKLEHQMKDDLRAIIEEREDQILIIPLQYRIYFETIGLPLANRERELILVMNELDDEND
jgi:CRISPR-associated protein Cas2